MNNKLYLSDAYSDMGNVMAEGCPFTTLTGWFESNKQYDHGRELTYLDYIKKFTWNSTGRRWGKRKRLNSQATIHYFTIKIPYNQIYYKSLCNYVKLYIYI